MYGYRMTQNTKMFAAFLSYVRNDDLHDDGRITDLRRRLSAEVQMQTGREFQIFQDRTDIFIGEQWRVRIETSINGTTLLIAIITPSFLQSEACREEVNLFAKREQRLGRSDLIIPVLYVPTPALDDESDEIAQNLSRRQRVDWTKLRFENPSSVDVRRMTATLAEHVIVAVERSKQPDSVETVPDQAPKDNGPGLIELLAETEDAMPLFSNTIVLFGEALDRFTQITASATTEMNVANKPGKPASAKLATIHRYTKRLEEPVAEMESLADEYIDQLTRVGSGGRRTDLRPRLADNEPPAERNVKRPSSAASPAARTLAENRAAKALASSATKPSTYSHRGSCPTPRALQYAGVDVLIEHVSNNEDVAERQAAEELLAALRTLAENGGKGLDSMEDLHQMLVSNYSLSSTLRPVLRRMSTALLKITPSRQVFNKWRDDLTGALA